MAEGIFQYHQECLDESCGSSDGLAVYLNETDDGDEYLTGFCYACEGYFSAKELDPDNAPKSKRESEKLAKEVKGLDPDFASYVEGLDTGGSKVRKIRKEFMEMYGVKMSRKESGAVLKHFYPLTQDNKICGYKVRELPKKFSAVGNTSPSSTQLFGQSVFEDGKVPVNKKFVLVTEGEADCIALQQVMADMGNPAFKNAVVSIPSGTGSAVKSIQQNWKWLNTFEQVVLFFDQDDPGKKAALDVAKKLPLGKCKIAKFSEKDPCDMLKKGKEKELYDAFWKSELYAPDGVLAGTGLWNLVTTPLAESNAHYPWDSLDSMLHGIRTSEMITLTAGCVDADTEFLTPRGWKRIADYVKGDQVAEYNINGSINFKEPKIFHKYETKSLWHIKTKYGVDMMLSDEHKVPFVTHYDPNTIRNKSVREIRNLHEKQTTGFGGRFITTFDCDGGVGINLTDEEIRVMVAVQGDGYFRCENTNHTLVRIKKDRKKVRLMKLLDEAGIKYTRRYVKPDGFETFTFYSPLRKKTYDDFWWDCDKHQLKVVADEVLHWDGNQENRFYSSDVEDVNFLQYVFASVGRRSTVMVDDRDSRNTKRPCYHLQIAKNDKVSFTGNSQGVKPEFVETPTKDGYKYCFTTSSGYWVMRRNYRIAVTGNSGVAKSTFARVIAHHLQKTTDDNIGMIFLEESVKKTSLQMMSLEAGKQLHLPETEVTPEEMRTAFDSTLGTGQYYFYDDFASQDMDGIVESIIYMARAANCKTIFLDHISMLVSGGEHGDERRALDAICTRLRSLVQQLDITLFIVTHLKRPPGIPHENGGETNIGQLRGTAGIAQLSDIVIGFERNSQAVNSKERNTTHVRVLKNRFSGETGLACSLLYNHNTGRIRELTSDEVDQMDTSDSEFSEMTEEDTNEFLNDEFSHEED